MTWVPPPADYYTNAGEAYPKGSPERWAATFLCRAQRYYWGHHTSCFNYPDKNLTVITFDTYWDDDPKSARYHDVVLQAVCRHEPEAENWTIKISQRHHTTAGVYTDWDHWLHADLKLDPTGKLPAVIKVHEFNWTYGATPQELSRQF